MRSVSFPGPAEAGHPQGWPLLRLGFRPFYLLAAVAAVALMPLWALIFLGRLQPAAGLPPVLWHAHEMLLGFVAAVVVGFLFTAGKNWTGLQTPRGAALGAIALLWVAGRVTAVLGPYSLFAAVDALLLPLVAVVFARLLLKARNHRNLGIAVMLGLLGAANLAFHGGVLASMDLLGRPAQAGGLNVAHQALLCGMALLVVIETVIAGRVIPMFTRNAVPGLATGIAPWRERLLLGSTFVGLALWLLDWGLPAALVLALAAALHAWRLASWKPWATRGRPILWSLHAAYLWIPVGLALLAAAQGLGQPASPGLHALGVGASAGLILAMMTRSSRGHTGRPLATTPTEAWAYRLVLLAAVVRVGTPLLAPQFYLAGLVVAGLCFAASFLLFLWVYAGWLMQPRVDGQDG